MYAKTLLLVSALAVLSFLPVAILKQETKPPVLSPSPKGKTAIRISESSYKNLFNGDVKVNNLKVDGDTAGYSVWLNRKNSNENRQSRIKAKYIARKIDNTTVADRYRSAKKGKKMILCCAGGYMSDCSSPTTPIGLCVDDGNIVNRTFGTDASGKDMNAIVIVEAIGGIRVKDIRKGINLVSLNRKVFIRQCNDDLNTFLKWCISENVWLFQTHLLAYDKELNVDTNMHTISGAKLILAAVIDSNNDIYHVFFSFPQVQKSFGFSQGQQSSGFLQTFFNLPKQLLPQRKTLPSPNLTEGIFNYLNEKNVEIVWMINLDAGFSDFFQVYDESGNECINVESKGCTFENTVNLLCYYYE